MIELPNINSKDKWSKPGWRREERYRNDVRIHNWVEEREQYPASQPDPMRVYHVHHKDLTSEHQSCPEIIIRKQRYLKHRGQPRSYLFGETALESKNSITWYDQNYNRRPRPDDQRFPNIRYWRGKHLYWHPEKSDYPMKGPGTNWGLKEQTKTDQQDRRAALDGCTYTTSYKECFQRPHTDMPAGMQRLAMPNIYTDATNLE